MKQISYERILSIVHVTIERFFLDNRTKGLYTTSDHRSELKVVVMDIIRKSIEECGGKVKPKKTVPNRSSKWD